MPNWTTPGAGVDEPLILSDRWQREHRTISRNVDDCESEDERGVVSRTEGSAGVWRRIEGELMLIFDMAIAIIMDNDRVFSVLSCNVKMIKISIKSY